LMMKRLQFQSKGRSDFSVLQGVSKSTCFSG
jgi:hypothetical protein